MSESKQIPVIKSSQLKDVKRLEKPEKEAEKEVDVVTERVTNYLRGVIESAHSAGCDFALQSLFKDADEGGLQSYLDERAEEDIGGFFVLYDWIRKQERVQAGNHYDAGGIQVFDILGAKMSPVQLEGFYLGNVIKYSTRYNFKADSASDGRKMADYSAKLDELRKEHPELSNTTHTAAREYKRVTLADRIKRVFNRIKRFFGGRNA